MNPDWTDKKLADLFSEMRQEDARRAPPFDEHWNTALSRARAVSPSRLRHRLAAAAILLAVLAGSALAVSRRLTSPSGLSETAASPLLVSKWAAPTDFLLDTPGTRLLRSLPRPCDSCVEREAL